MVFSNFPVRILHGLLVAVVAAGLLGSAAAQRSLQSKPKTPRALALVEWPAKGAPRLVPVCILIDGQYYDAGIYMADPVPMVLDTGNVFEVEHSGEPEGFFTVNEAQQVGDSWIGIGGFQSLQAVHAAENTPPSKATSAVTTEDSGPPKLRRPGAEKQEPQPNPPPAKPQTTPPAQTPGDEGPPVLKKPAQPAPAAPPQASSAPAPPPSDEGDPNRPRLRRGRPAALAAEETIEAPKSAVTASSAPTPKAAPNAASPQNPAAQVRVLPAISDAKGPDPRNYAFDWTAQEQQHITQGMQNLARTVLQEYAKGRSETPGALENVQVKAFDLDLSNEAVFVLTATAQNAPPAPPRATRGRRAPEPQPEAAPAKQITYYVTVIARQDLEGNLRRIFKNVTDSSHLDAYARLELIDAVDVNGDGRGELLFRAINDQTRAFVIYRADPDTLTELFNSGELQR